MDQRTLFDDAPPTLQERFDAFHRSHPDVYALFTRFALELRATGRERYSADAILHRIRWHYATSSSGEAPKINDHWSSRYARLLMDERPEFRGFFETRTIRTP